MCCGVCNPGYFGLSDISNSSGEKRSGNEYTNRPHRRPLAKSEAELKPPACDNGSGRVPGSFGFRIGQWLEASKVPFGYSANDGSGRERSRNTAGGGCASGAAGIFEGMK